MYINHIIDGVAPPLIPALPAFASVGVGRTRAYALLNSGKVPAVKVGKKTMIRRPDWEKFTEAIKDEEETT